MSFITFSLYIICIFIRPQDWMPMLNGAPIVNFFAIITIMFLFLESFGKGKGGCFARTHQVWMMCCFFVIILLSHAYHLYFWGIKNAFIIFFPTFILFFLIHNAINSELRLKLTIWLIIFIMSILVFQGMYQVANGYGWAGQPITIEGDVNGDSGVGRINWIGIFNNPNDLSQAFVIAIGFLLPFVFSKGNFIKIILSAIFAGFLVYGLYLANSRGGMLALIVTILFFFVRKTKKYFIGGIFGGASAILIFIFGPSRMSSISSGEASASSRLDLWYGGLQELKLSPIFGMGQGMFPEKFSLTAHNTYMLVVSELGLLGLFFWIGLIYISIKELSFVQRMNIKLQNYALGIQCALIGFSVASFFSARLYVILPYMLFAMAGASLWLTQKSCEGVFYKFKNRDILNIFLLCIVVLVLIYLSIKFR